MLTLDELYKLNNKKTPLATLFKTPIYITHLTTNSLKTFTEETNPQMKSCMLFSFCIIVAQIREYFRLEKAYYVIKAAILSILIHIW